MKTESKKRREAQEDMMTKTDPTLLSNTTFALIPELHPSTKRAIVEHMGLKTMTEIQSKAFHPIFSGSDVVGQARTGTGKTLAYLVPALQRLFYLQSMNLFRPNRDVGVVILSPVRELAVQIAEQVEDLLRFHDPPTSISSSSSHPRISVQVLSGSTSVGRDVAEMNQRIPSIISATPGRLLEHLQNTRVHARHFGKDIMKHTKILIIDEADRLLDMGFHEDLSSILSYLPRKENRQTLMFSATMSQSLRRAIPPMIREESFVSIDCVGHGETNVQVKQSHIVLPTVDDYVHSLIHILHHTMEKNKTSYKIIVFFPTARLVSYFAKLFQVVFGTTVLELHSKKSLGHRHRVHDLFYASKNGILCTSDVSSRGIDYPDVTLVLQFGLPESRDQYVHRLGRTARAGKMGSGLLVLCPFESIFLQQLQGLDVNKDSEIEHLLKSPSNHVTDNLNRVLHDISKGDASMQYLAEQAYQSFLGYYVDKWKCSNFRSKEEVVKTANNIARLMGLGYVPHLSKDVVHKMGLSGIEGICLAKEREMVHRRGSSEHEDGRHQLR